MRVRVHVCVSVHAYVCVRMFVCVYACVCVCLCLLLSVLALKVVQFIHQGCSLCFGGHAPGFGKVRESS